MIAAIGAILIGYSAVNLRKGKATTLWPSVNGKILGSDVRSEEQVRERKQKLLFYNADVKYNYTVNGKEYVSDKIRADLRGKTQTDEARRLVQLYSPGRTVAVYYNPRSPGDAVLEPGANPQTQTLLASGIALVVVAGAMLLVRFVWRK